MSRRNQSHSRSSAPKRFLSLPWFLLEKSPDFGDKAPLHAMSESARQTLYFLLWQYNGRNNGDLSIAPAVCAKYGIARSVARRGLMALAHCGLVIETRHGGLNHCSLYAITWLGIDAEVSSKFDDGIEPSPVPLRAWMAQYAHHRTRHLVEKHEKFLQSRKGGRLNGRDLKNPLHTRQGKESADLHTRRGKAP